MIITQQHEKDKGTKQQPHKEGKGMTVEIEKETLFSQIEKMSDDGIDEECTKAMVTDIINVLRGQELTYNQAFGVLKAVQTTLSVMSNSLAV